MTVLDKMNPEKGALYNAAISVSAEHLALQFVLHITFHKSYNPRSLILRPHHLWVITMRYEAKLSPGLCIGKGMCYILRASPEPESL